MGGFLVIERSVGVFDRGADGVYLHAYAYTDMGVLLAVPPFEHVSESDKHALLWKRVAELLSKPQERVPHPKQWDQLDPMAKMAGCKNWSQFARRAAYCSVRVEAGEYTFSPGKWDGKGFSGLKSQRKVVPIGADDRICQQALFETLSASRAASQHDA